MDQTNDLAALKSNAAVAARVAEALALPEPGVSAALALFQEGATIPCLARYRKERTGGLDEVALAGVRDESLRLEALFSRKKTILTSLRENGHLTEALEERIGAAETPAALEDIYLPYKPKRRTRAQKAREAGLEPLAERLFAQTGIQPEETATAFINPETGIETVAAALSGARDIIAERIAEDADARAAVRRLFSEKALLKSRVVKGKEAEGGKYRDYFDWAEPAESAPSHRILAARRGEAEGILNLEIAPDPEEAIALLKEQFVTGDGPDAKQVESAVVDGYKRLLSRAMETEIRLRVKERADRTAIDIFAENLQKLLMAPPLGQKAVMAIDPGFRTGCKLVCLDTGGELLFAHTIYPHSGEDKRAAAADTVKRCCNEWKIEAIAVGNGTAGRETEAFLRDISLDREIPVVLTDESGASIYSASKIAREELPDQDVTVRGAVSIGRRLMDPLSELVKLDPKSIGVGQYQHDVEPAALRQALDDTVVGCVNRVGVDVNRAGFSLLSYVSGLGPALARGIVQYRATHGPFAGREALRNVPRLGPKAFEQAAGFLRIIGGRNPLDESAVHPESYSVVAAMARDLDCDIPDLVKNAALRNRIDPGRYITGEIGIPTITDILGELDKPGRDPREAFESFSFAPVTDIGDLTEGMTLPGIVTNVTAFGAFVDIGVHRDGLVHISELSDRFVKDPAEVVTVRQKVRVTVLSIDTERNRISLSMRGGGKPAVKPSGGEPLPVRRKKAAPKTPGDSGTGRKHPPESKKRRGAQKDDKPFHNPFADAFNNTD